MLRRADSGCTLPHLRLKQGGGGFTGIYVVASGGRCWKWSFSLKYFTLSIVIIDIIVSSE